MRLLPEEERQETLAILARNRVEVEKQLAALPIVIETPSMVGVRRSGGGQGVVQCGTGGAALHAMRTHGP
jgi:hypothetical protein